MKRNIGTQDRREWKARYLVRQSPTTVVAGLFLLAFAFVQVIAEPLRHEPGVPPPDQLRQDFHLFKRSLETTHPALYWSISKKDLDALMRSSEESINETMSEAHFYLMLRRITSAIGDGHLACDPPQGTIGRMFADQRLFPWRLWFRGSRAFLLCGDGAEVGAEVVSIDGMRMDALIPRMLQYLPGDGAIGTKKRWSLSEGGFSLLYHWLNGDRVCFRVEYRSRDGKTQVTTLPAAILGELACFREGKNQQAPLQLEFMEDDIAVVRIGTFDINRLDDDPTAFPKFLESSFKQIKERNTPGVIIDLRNNAGGEDAFGALLYSYLSDKAFPYYESLETITSKYPADAHPNLAIQTPALFAFHGMCVFLVNGKSYSTTAEFCAIARSNRRGLFIGEETGGAYRGNTGGEKEIVLLPNTQVKLIIPRRKYVLAVRPSPHMDRGVIPDETFSPLVGDTVAGRDVELARALQLVRERKSEDWRPAELLLR